jgi:hypothetical protein
MQSLRPFQSNGLDAGGMPADQKRNKLMSIQEVSVEQFAQLFHYYHQALANDSGSAGAIRSKDAWADVPPSEKSRMIAAARLALVELTPVECPPRPHFATPGEAEWGC